MQLIAPQLALALLISLPFVWLVGFPRYAYRRRRDLLSLLLRSLIMLLLVLALAGLQLVQAADRLALVFLVDASDSMGAATQEQQLAFIRAAVAAKQPDDLWATLLFGENAVPETDFSKTREVNAFRSRPQPTGTDIAKALQTALAMFPPDAARRIVLLSDGQPTQGNATARAQRAAAAAVEISYLPLFRPAQADARITAVDVPSRIGEGQSFDLALSLHADRVTPATLLIHSGSRLIHEEQLQLPAGTSRYSLTQTAEESGFLAFSAQLLVEGDALPQNNQLGAFSQVVGPARILLLSRTADEVQYLQAALEQAGIRVDSATPSELPVDLLSLASYKALILANVPATQLSRAQMTLLDSYVSTLGGGLLVIGGPDSYAPGGYYRSPLEDILPVDMQIKDQKRLPQLTIAYLIDRSGSMAQTGRSGVPNLELGKRAIVMSLELLQESDRVAIGTFDTGGAWVAPFQPVNDAQTLIAMTNTIRAGGGTDILAGLQLVERDIAAEPSQLKHLILLTDGGARSTGILDLGEQLRSQQDLTLSVIAIGRNPGSFLEPLAEVGGGNYYAVSDVEQIPLILAQETVLASRSYIVEEPFTPEITGTSAILEGIDSLPQLRGYVATTAKVAAQRILSGPEPFADPILAAWQYGLGRVLAWTSDASARWARDWVTWNGFSRFWAQALAWSINASNNNLETTVSLRDGRAHIRVDARADDGHFLNGLTLSSTVLNPGGTSLRIPLQQSAPGLYQASFRPENEGAYFLNVQANTADTPLTDLKGWVMSYSPEYIPKQQDERLLAELAEITGGSNLQGAPQAAFTRSSKQHQTTSDIWERLVLLALLLLPLDIALRRLVITRADLQHLWPLWRRQGEAAPRSQEMEALFRARSRSRIATDYGDGITPPSPPPDSPPSPASPASPASPPDSGQRNLGGDLLRKRRSRAQDS